MSKPKDVYRTCRVCGEEFRGEEKKILKKMTIHLLHIHSISEVRKSNHEHEVSTLQRSVSAQRRITVERDIQKSLKVHHG